MRLKHAAAFAALIAACAPGMAFDFGDQGASTVFYISVPLDARLPAKERAPAFGLRLQGKREYQALDIDSRRLRLLGLDDVEPKWIVAGLVALAATLAITRKDKSIEESQQSAPPAQPCPQVPKQC